AFPAGPEWLWDRRSTAEQRRRPDRPPPRPHWARGRQREDSGNPPFPSTPLPASNRALFDPPRISSQQSIPAGDPAKPPHCRPTPTSLLGRRKSSAAKRLEQQGEPKW